MRRIALGLLLLTAACSGRDAAPSEFPATSDPPFALVASTDLAVGPDRVLVGLRAPTGEALGSPTEDATVRLWPQDAPDEVVEAGAEFVWIVPDAVGLYAAQVEFDRAGVWYLDVETGAGVDYQEAAFIVHEEHGPPAVGEAAIRTVTATTAGFPLSELTTDPDPDASLYDVSLHEALGSGRATVVVFATPAFCTTQACGPMLEQVKSLMPEFPQVEWVHVEIYENINDDANRRRVAAVRDWELPTEPWVFVADAAGVITARFEGVVGDDELRRAVRAVA